MQSRIALLLNKGGSEDQEIPAAKYGPINEWGMGKIIELNIVRVPKFLFSSLNKKKKEVETNGKNKSG